MELKQYPDSVLRKRARPVQRVDDEVVARADRMLEFMYESEGIGLAAPQIGWCDRVVTLDVELTREGPRIFVNPRIVEREGQIEQKEGCLSLPGVYVTVPRAARITVVAYTLAGERVEFEAEDLHSCAWQHELDHLNGVLIIDKISPVARMAVRTQLKRLQQGPERPGPRL